MGRGDGVIFTAVGNAQVFDAGEILASPTYSEHPIWKKRFPWVYPVRIDVWVPRVTDGPRLSKVAPKKVLGHIQAGAPYAELTRDQYAEFVRELLRVRSAQARAGFNAPE